ncbi:MAG: hypothetical protein RE471_04850 [Ferroplasma sp.]|jgi:hypothetical protein|uniref:hypothetical protein n=1 Tax=Ferroplasma sp. TaxID=2591003 RepID=UPI0028163CAF|nr:hypothetical protein [Ferroplasma sp.]WMT52210.1 MAG: hypothetical protein RE471_04850 [Ferroplasma sp.]
MSEIKKHANIAAPGKVKGRIIMELIQPLKKYPEPISKDELRETIGLTRENLKFHLMDRQTGLVPNGIVKERLGILTLNFRDTESVVKAVNYIATRKAIREAIEAYFAEAFISVYGEFFHCDMYDLEQLSPEYWDLYNDLNEKALQEMEEQKRLRIGYKEIDIAKKLLEIRRGKNDAGFMFLYAEYALFLHTKLGTISPKKLCAEQLTLSQVPNHLMYSWVELFLKNDIESFNDLLRRVIRNGMIEVTNPEEAGVFPYRPFSLFDSKVPSSERVLFNYIEGRRNIEAYNIEDLEEIQNVLVKEMQGKTPLSYEVIQSTENKIILRRTGRDDL